MQLNIVDLGLGLAAAAPAGGQGGEAVRMPEVRWRDQNRAQGRRKVCNSCL